jgi:hypothetical protein
VIEGQVAVLDLGLLGCRAMGCDDGGWWCEAAGRGRERSERPQSERPAASEASRP